MYKRTAYYKNLNAYESNIIHPILKASIRTDFPVFEQFPRLAYLDNAATTQMPHSVIEAMQQFNSYGKANIHRGVYDLSNQATERYEEVRAEVAAFIGAEDSSSISFTKGTTESINVIARSFLQPRLKAGDNVVTTIMEHHANFLPWQVLCEEKDVAFRVAPIDENGDLSLAALERMLNERTQLLAINHISNTLGTINPVKEIIRLAHSKGIPVLLDAAQSAACHALDVQDLGCDFLVFSAHKLFGPFGVGVLYVGEKFWEEMQPYNYGGGMIRNVTAEGSSYAKYPHSLDAGTPNVSGVVGMGAAISYIQSLDCADARNHIRALTAYAVSTLMEIEQLKIIGSPRERSGILPFVVKDIHPHDVASFLNKDHIAVRAGMHCTQPLLDHLGVSATVRASFSIYNTREEIDRLAVSLIELIKFWS